MSEKVDHPDHYRATNDPENVYEAIKIIEAWDLNFSLGNVIKYILRAGKKKEEIKDLEKALWYLNRHIQNIKK
tara:strand:+ start:121 stop:339 length:219 start_codon:yes stop_codon:yes gene_type:complete